MPATRGSYGFPLFSSCRDDDELLQYPSAFMAEASGRSMSCRGFVEKDGAHDVSSSSRWPHEYCAHMQVPAASLRTCPYCFSTIVCSGIPDPVPSPPVNTQTEFPKEFAGCLREYLAA